MTARCAFGPKTGGDALAGVDVKLPSPAARMDVANWAESASSESDSTFLGDWNIPLGVVVFVTTLGREAAGNVIDVAARV